ncbi:MAG: hypothetical protein K5873_06880 [Treponema sp.]|nr:hypothetical protein [Treponema sp.]
MELALDIMEDETLAEKYRPTVNRSPEYWCSWVLAYFQWQTNLMFKEINNYIPISDVIALYTPYE